MYCENTLGIDSEGEDSAYIFITKYSTNRLFDFDNCVHMMETKILEKLDSTFGNM